MTGRNRFCDGLTRRDMLRGGAGGLLGVSLPGYLGMRQAAGGGAAAMPARSVIFLWLSGGMSHLDTFDLKPDAPAEIRGEFKPIPSSVDGLQVSEHLPHMAKQMDQV